MKIATWNVNSIRSRLEHVVAWLEKIPIDVLLLQEIKCVEEQFPKEIFEDLGYNTAIFGQKTYNGVAILSKYPIEDVQKNIPNFEDAQSRYIEAVINKKRVISLYVPNGFEVGDEKYFYKLKFLDALCDHLKVLHGYREEVIVGGDFNIVPGDIDTYDAKLWKDCILCSEPERKQFQRVLNLGYVDAFRTFYPDKQQFTWWDYRKNSYENNLGLRIDHFLLSPEACDTAKDIQVDESVRRLPKASDHIPVILNF
jgi:exodeoxyribonuclease-3